MTKLLKTCVAVATATLLATTLGGGTATAAEHARHPSPTQDGVWRMDGYGTVLTIRRNGAMQLYETTSISCLKGPSATRSAVDGRTTTYDAGDGAVLTVEVRPDPRQARLRFTYAPGYRGLRRVASLPAACSRPAPTDPRAVFDVFWQTYAENYPFFAAKGIDWQSARDRYRPRVGAHTTDDELFAIFREMLDPLNDAHVFLAARPDLYFAEGRPGTVVPDAELDRRTRDYIRDRDLGGRPLSEYGQGRIGYADLPGDQGYLRVSTFIGYVEDPLAGYAAESAELDRALDAVLTPERVRRLRGLIVDLRVNGGGSDKLGLRLAARLTDRPHFAYAKRARNDPHDPTRFTRPQPMEVRPAPGATRYSGPLAVLTGGSTVSAGETFTQALIERPGYTIRIGEPTQGVFSDVLERVLPNGWHIGLPNEEFRTADGRTFDGAGIPPHLAEPVFTDEEFAQHRDSAFDRAVATLRTEGT
ncbi:S41 family peptidase [Embleya sp. NBC_00896]|uniref:S41 family peptidase n=1 Tax=Embleya sp. NBC_00896 TaxID=2975961 RepID=UPI003867CD84|nr:S41 family peptidase [Embleya sp. NBC_00896]